MVTNHKERPINEKFAEVLAGCFPRNLLEVVCDPRQYMTDMLETIGDAFADIPAIIVRKKAEDNYNFNIYARYKMEGLSEEELIELTKDTVNITGPMVEKLIESLKKEKEEQYVIIDDPQHDPAFGPKPLIDRLIERWGVKAVHVLSVPIPREEILDGFIVFFKKSTTDVEGFNVSSETRFLTDKIRGVIEKVFYFAEDLSQFVNQYEDLKGIEHQEIKAAEVSSDLYAAYARLYVADRYLEKNQFKNAGENYRIAGDKMAKFLGIDLRKY